MSKYVWSVSMILMYGVLVGCAGPMTLVKANHEAYAQMNKLEARGYTVEVAKGSPRDAARSDDGKRVEAAQMESCEAARANGETALIKRIIGYYGKSLTETGNLKLTSAEAQSAVKERLSHVRPFYETNTVELNCVMVIGLDPASKKDLKVYIDSLVKDFYSKDNAPERLEEW